MLFAFEETEDWIMSTSRHIAWESTSEGIINRLNRVVGNPVILNFLGEIDSVTMEKAIDIYGESSRPYFEELSDAAVMVDALMSEVMVSENEKLLSRKTGHQLNSSIKLPEIESLQDLMNADILNSTNGFDDIIKLVVSLVCYIFVDVLRGAPLGSAPVCMCFLVACRAVPL